MMELITLNIVTNFLVHTNNRKMFYAILIAIFGAVYMWLTCEYLDVNIMFSVILVALILFLFVWQKKRDKKLKNNEFYIAEDVFINIKRRKMWTRYAGRFESCTLKFSRNGTYDVNIFEKSEPEKPSCDYSAVNFSKPGDKFYLLIIQGETKNIILKCFNAKYYKVLEDDFEYIDGKYYPKKM